MTLKKLFTVCACAAAVSAMAVFPAFASGWQQNDKGYWYEREDSSYPAGTWEQIGGTWYLFDQNGYMLTGWQQVGNDWFYMEESGAMISGTTRTIDGKNYTFSVSGAMVEDKAGVTMGHFAGRTFINDWSNLRLTIPNDFLIAGPEYLSSYQSNGEIVDMVALKSETCGVMVMYTDAPFPGMDWRDAIDAFNQLFASAPNDGVPYQTETAMAGGEQYLKMHIPEGTDEISGDLYIKGAGDYMAAVFFIYDSSSYSDLAPVISSLSSAH